MYKNEFIYPVLIGSILAIVGLRENGKITVSTAFKEIVRLLERASEK